MTDVAKALTWLGAAPVSWTVVLIAVLWLASRERRAEALALLAGLVMTIVLVHVLKAAVGRPRPPDPVVAASGSSFPSGHTAYAAAYVAAALALRRRALVIAAVVVAIVVAWTRVELRVHYVTDVLGGAALAALCFAVAWWVVARLRNNEGEAA